MIPDLAYTSRDFYTSNQVKFKFTYLSSGLSITDLYIKSFCYLVNILNNKTDVHIREKS